MGRDKQQTMIDTPETKAINLMNATYSMMAYLLVAYSASFWLNTNETFTLSSPFLPLHLKLTPWVGATGTLIKCII